MLLNAQSMVEQRTVYPPIVFLLNSFSRPNQYRRSRLRFRSRDERWERRGAEGGGAKIIGLPAHFRELSILRPRRISSRIRPDRINTNAQVGAGEIGTYGKGASEDKRAWARGNCIPRINLCRGRTPPTFPGRGRLWNFSIYLCRFRAAPVLFHIITNGQEELGGCISAGARGKTEMPWSAKLGQ